MLHHYLSAALRNFARFRLATAVNVLGLALGLACFIAAYATIAWLRSGDLALANTERVVIIAERVRIDQIGFDSGFRPTTSPPVTRYLPIDFPELEGVARLRYAGQLAVSSGDTHAYIRGAVAQGELLDLLALPFSERIARNPLIEPRGVVLTHEAAIKLFGTRSALGRRVVLHRALDVTVTGVLKPIKQPSHVGPDGTGVINFDVLFNPETELARRIAVDGAPPQELSELEQWGNPNGGITYALLPKDGSLTVETLDARLAEFARRRGPPERRGLNVTFRALRLADIRLANLDTKLFRSGGVSLTSLALGLAWLIVGIACVNYANLAVAQTLVRYRELGVRRVLGAARRQLMMHYTVEAGLQTTLALIVALILVIAVALNVFPVQAPAWIATVAARAHLWGAILLSTLMVCLLIAAYPAFAASAAQPAQIMRGSTLRSGRGVAARFFVGLQFAATSLMLIGLIVVHLQNANMRRHALQVMDDPTVIIALNLKPSGVAYETLKHELSNAPGVVAVSATNVLPWFAAGNFTTISRDGGATQLYPIVASVQYDFEAALSMKLVAGRSFSQAAGDAVWPNYFPVRDGREYPAVIDRRLARDLGWSEPSEAIGQVFHQPGERGAPASSVRVIGVIEDKPLRLETLNGSRANMYTLSGRDDLIAMVRVRRDQLAAGLKSIDATWARLAPQVPLQRKFTDEFFEQEFATFSLVGRLLTLMTLIGSGIAAMGLFAFALFVANRRSHEIGVRKTMGARTTQLLVMLVKDFSQPILWANLLIWPLAYVFAKRYLNTFVDRVALDAWPFVLSLLVTIVVAWLAVGGRALRAARVKPAEVLRYE